MANADPPNKVGDGKAPGNRDVKPPDAHSLGEQVDNHSGEQEEDARTKKKGEKPRGGYPRPKHNAADPFRNRRKGQPRDDVLGRLGIVPKGTSLALNRQGVSRHAAPPEPSWSYAAPRGRSSL